MNHATLSGNRKAWRSFTAAMSALAIVLGLLVAAPAAQAQEKDAAVAEALSQVTRQAKTPERALLSGLASTAKPDARHAMLSRSNGARIGVPSSADRPITMTGAEGGPSLAIGITGAEGAAKPVVPGVTSFDHGDGSTTATIAKADGSLQLVSVIQGASSPTEWSYSLQAPGLRLELGDDGSVTGFNGDDHPVMTIAPAWAVDATGAEVPTRYEVDGTTITQIVDHTRQKVVYPVVADPRISWFWWGIGIKFSHSETRQIASSTSDAAALATLCGIIANAPGAVVCGLSGFLVAGFGASWVKGVAARGHCLQLNAAWLVPALPYEVNC
jgi:hypothetical protein